MGGSRKSRNQGIPRLMKSQPMRMSVIYMYYLNTRCPLGHHYNGPIATGALRQPFMGMLKRVS